MAKKEKPKKNSKKNKKKITIIVISVVLIAAVAATAFFLFIKKKTEAAMNEMMADMAASSIDAVTAYGVINIGTVDEELDIENMTNSLIIEEILFSAGDDISEGDALLKFTEESVSDALAELKQNLREKELAYRSGEIEYEQSLITAKYNYDSTILKGKQADEVYKETVASLKDNLASAKKTYTEATEQLAEYKDAQVNNTYYTEYKVEEYKNLYDENLALLNAKISEWNVSWSDVTGRGARIGADTYSQYKYILQNFYSILETNLKNYENALDKYESDQADLNYNLLSLQLDMSSLEETYVNAQKSYETNLLAAEQTRQTAKTNAELAESEYEAKIEKAKTDYDTVKSAYEDALKDYNTFTERIVDNTYLAAKSGTVMRTSVRNNGRVSAGGRILMYADQNEATVSVSVDQADIAKLAVGDTAVCYASSTGLLNGTIVSISPITQSTSRSSVTYSVTVKLGSTSTSLSSNTTVTVMFGVDMSSLSGVTIPTQNESENSDFGDFNFEGMPDMSNFGGGNMPDMSNFGGGNIPNMGGR